MAELEDSLMGKKSLTSYAIIEGVYVGSYSERESIL